MPIPSLQKLVAALGDEFPMLQYPRIEPLTRRNTHLILPTTFEVQHLRHLILNHFASPIRSTLLQVTAVGLVTPTLWWTHPSTYPPINHMLQTLSLLHRLGTLEIGFRSPFPSARCPEAAVAYADCHSCHISRPPLICVPRYQRLLGSTSSSNDHPGPQDPGLFLRSTQIFYPMFPTVHDDYRKSSV